MTGGTASGAPVGRRPDRGRRPSDLAREAARAPSPRSGGAGGARPRGWPPGFGAGERERRALTVLLGLSSLTPRILGALAAEHGSAAACLGVVRGGGAASPSDRARVRAAPDAGAEAVAAAMRACGCRLVAPEDPEYPAGLLDLHDPPAGLFVRGAPMGTPGLRIAVVGARNCSPAGLETASAIARGLAVAGVGVVSGGARGIDAAAHRGALEAGGPTIAVLGSGIDMPYPRSNRRLFAAVESSGTIVSEYPPGTPAEPFRFPARNRLVAALSVAVVVVEGTAGSGSMITADHALDIGREVFAVPGPVASELAQAPLSLIREGAGLVRGADDLLCDLGIEPAGARSGSGRAAVAGPDPPSGEPAGDRLPQAEAAVWSALSVASTADVAAAAAGLSLPEALGALSSLELRGLVRAVGGRFERCAGVERR